MSQQPVDPIQVLSDITVFGKYAKFQDHLARREVWPEIIDRLKSMHKRKFPHLVDEIDHVYDTYVLPKKILPSMRSLQFGGLPIELANNRGYNCAFVPVEHVDAFPEVMFQLLGGTGMGYSVQRHDVEKLPPVQHPTKERRYVIGDSIEGWADAVKVLVKAYFTSYDYRPVFDYRDIRPKGARLVTSGGKAPGPEPLRIALEKIEAKLRRMPEGHRLTPIQAHDIMCLISDAVLAGGIRRAALISLFDRDDEAMLNAKSSSAPARLIEVLEVFAPDLPNDLRYNVRVEVEGEVQELILKLYDYERLVQENLLGWWAFALHRARANNSAVLPRGEVSEEEFFALWAKVQASGSGEPGFFWTNDVSWGTNPCAEISLRPYQFCNLCEINAHDIESQEDLEARAKAAAFIGTLQASYTDFHYLRPVWRETTEEDALIGVGATGIASGNFTRFDLETAAQRVREENERVAGLIGIKPAARLTTVKPSGTSSLVLGTSSGIHAWHNDHYIRRSRLNKNEALYPYLKRVLPDLVEDDVTAPDTTAIVTIPVKAPVGAVTRHETVFDLLERVADVNERWVRAGHVRGVNANNVSATISVKDDEWAAVGAWMWEHRDRYNGLSVLPYNGGTYRQAPFEDITEARYHELVGQLANIDLRDVFELDDQTDLTAELACAGGACEIEWTVQPTSGD